jgi:cell shape-determining protein MreD
LRDLFFLIAGGFILAVIQTTSLGFSLSPAYKPDLLLAFIAWASRRVAFPLGIVFAFALGMLVDLTSGSIPGLFAILYCLMFVMGTYLDATLQVEGYLLWAAFIASGSAASGFVAVSGRLISGGAGNSFDVLSWIVLKSLGTGVAAVILLRLLDGLWAGYMRFVGVR